MVCKWCNLRQELCFTFTGRKASFPLNAYCAQQTRKLSEFIVTQLSHRDFSATFSGKNVHFQTHFYIIVTGFWCLTCTYRASRRPDGSWMVRTPQGACRSLYPQQAWTLSLYSLTAVATSIGQSLQSGEKQKVSKTWTADRPSYTNPQFYILWVLN